MTYDKGNEVIPTHTQSKKQRSTHTRRHSSAALGKQTDAIKIHNNNNKKKASA